MNFMCTCTSSILVRLERFMPLKLTSAIADAESALAQEASRYTRFFASNILTLAMNNLEWKMSNPQDIEIERNGSM